MKTEERERLTRVADSAARLQRLVKLEARLDGAAEIVLRNELKILWRRSLALWIRMRWPRLAAWWNGR